MSGGLVAGVRSRLPAVSHQFALVVAVAIVPVLVALIVFGWLMVISGDAAIVIALLTALAGAVAVLGARLFAHQMSEDVTAISRAVERVARGEREVRIATHADDEIGALGRRVLAMADDLAAEEAARTRVDRARRELLAAVSHDLRTPLTSMRLLTEAISDEIVTGTQREAYLARLKAEIASLGRLIDDLFELSRLEAGDIAWSMEQVDLGDLVHETVAAMHVHAERKHVRVSAELAGDLAPVHVNPEQIQRVLFNLIQNAIRFTPSDGSVLVHAARRARGTEVEVADSGPGIPTPERGDVFTPFFRGDHARGSEGSGLGLAIARAIVEAHGGSIWVADSRVGASVRFCLPDGSDGAAESLA